MLFRPKHLIRPTISASLLAINSMQLPQMIAKMLNTLERLLTNSLAASNSAWKCSSLVREHVPLKLVLAVEERILEADAALKNFPWLTSWWDVGDDGADDDCGRLRKYFEAAYLFER